MSLFYSPASFILNYNPISLGIYSASKAYNSLFNNNVKNIIQNYNLFRKPNIDDIKKYELIILDMDGVLRQGTKKIGLSDVVIKKMNNLNIPYIILTNECRKDPKTIRHDLEMMNLKIKKNTNIISSSLLVKNKLIDLLTKSDRSKSIGIISNIDNYNYLKLKINKKVKNVKTYWINDDMIPLNLDYIVIGCLENDEKFDKNIFKSLQWIDNNPNSEIIISCSDIDSVENNNTYYLPVNILKEIENRVNNKHSSINFNLINNDLKLNTESRYKQYKIKNKQIIIGKPYVDCMKDILKYYKIDIPNENNHINNQKINNKGKVLVVGDNIHTDIKLGEKINCDTTLVMSGITSYETVEKLIQIPKYEKTINNIKYIIPDISYLTL